SGDPTALATSLDNRADAQTASGDIVGAAQTSQRWFELMDRFLVARREAGEAMLVPLIEQHAVRLDAAGRHTEADGLRQRAQTIRLQYPEKVAKVDHQIARMAAADG